MHYAYLIIIVLILIFLFYICYAYYYDKNLKYISLYMDKTYQKNKSKINHVPKIIIQTYHDKSKIPSKVYHNIKKYAPEYEHIIYDDKECIEFLKENYNDLVVNRFKSFKEGAHKADLFRYCYLYKFGGIYLDIKINLIKPLSKIFTDNKLYTVSSIFKGTIFQGIICTPPNNPIFKVLINKILNTSNFVLKLNYLTFTSHFYTEIMKHSKKDYKLFKEICNNNINQDLDYDRYGRKCAIYDKNERIFNTRYSDYPW